MAGLSVALLCALATTFAVVTFEPIRSFREETASCLGAENIERAVVPLSDDLYVFMSDLVDDRLVDRLAELD